MTLDSPLASAHAKPLPGLPFAAPVPRRTEVIRAFKERGGRVAAVLPIHYPRALFRAFGVLPVEVWGPPNVDAARGAAHLQPYVCSIVRNALSFLEAGGLDGVDVIVVPHACDSLQGLGSLLLDFIRPRQPVLPLYLPRGERGSDVAFLTDELRSLSRRLEEVTHRSPSAADLADAIRQEEEANRLAAELYRQRARLPLPDTGFYRLVRSREYLPAEAFSALAGAALARTGEVSRDGIPLLLSGIVPEPAAFLEALTELGGVVVGDDLACCGRRLYPPGTSDEPFRRLAESILAAPPDPTRGSPIRDRVEHLLRLVREMGARGVVFHDIKFCEPELFDLPHLSTALQHEGVPSLTVEVDLSEPLSGQLLTRLEAFLEMLA
jgi:benzoyl-CoA reductase/2-hydroxyglutaryl-CoA dehydratase subunit BcrC/BadD/HgdB